MAKEFGRNARVGSQMQRELADLVRNELKDPRLGRVSIHEVRVSRDLSSAKIYIGALEGEAVARASAAALNHAAPFLRKELSRRMRLRNTPELHFAYDDAQDRGLRLDELLGQISRARNADTDSETPAE